MTKNAIRMKRWRAKDPVRANKISVAWSSENPEKRRESNRRYRLNNLAKDAQRKREYLRQNPGQRIAHNARIRIRLALKGQAKSATTRELLGCSEEHLRVWLTFYFQPGMSWANYGKIWHVDHIYPCSRFDLSDPAQQKECFHYTNLQPLFVLENLSKGNKVLE